MFFFLIERHITEVKHAYTIASSLEFSWKVQFHSPSFKAIR